MVHLVLQGLQVQVEQAGLQVQAEHLVLQGLQVVQELQVQVAYLV